MLHSDFPLVSLTNVIQSLVGGVENGRGVALIRGIGNHEWELDDYQVALWGIGLNIGTAVPQSRKGDRIGFVCDKGSDINIPTNRGYESNATLPFHSDRSDVTALLCVNKAIEGGETGIVSMMAVHRELHLNYPHLLEALYKGLPHDRRGEQRQGESPWTNLPVFSYREGVFVARYIRRFVEGAMRFPDAPRLTKKQIQALDILDHILENPRFSYWFTLKPGDLLLLNNHVVAHSRKSFVDSKNYERRRILLRLWLATPKSRQLPLEFLPLFGAILPGEVRGGVFADDMLLENNSKHWRIK